jgi:hypothetical protein
MLRRMTNTLLKLHPECPASLVTDGNGYRHLTLSFQIGEGGEFSMSRGRYNLLLSRLDTHMAGMGFEAHGHRFRGNDERNAPVDGDHLISYHTTNPETIDRLAPILQQAGMLTRSKTTETCTPPKLPATFDALTQSLDKIANGTIEIEGQRKIALRPRDGASVKR